MSLEFPQLGSPTCDSRSARPSRSMWGLNSEPQKADSFGFAVRCAEKLRFSDESLNSFAAATPVDECFRSLGDRRHSRQIFLEWARKSGAFPHIEGQSPKKKFMQKGHVRARGQFTRETQYNRTRQPLADPLETLDWL